MEQPEINNAFYFNPMDDVINKIYIEQSHYRDQIYEHYLNYTGDLRDTVDITEGWCNISIYKKDLWLENNETWKEKLNKDLTLQCMQNVMLKNKSILSDGP